ncbi:hypothetical protein [Pelagicoccus sp. SDUM812002]|uniref:hypothetical protein n=1 Tax=Pelagicoccus sp. SDUM812002 TaxID=3041266 RepID=UPI00280F0E5D|nr:hypothetical protein [Pelagicoccus sp. SDUM812002]MDQ8187090.1 hypothetical protein [Pelagicoccus sp. SDUM812002]
MISENVIITRYEVKEGYCIFIESLCEGLVPSVFDGDNKPVVFDSLVEAESEIEDYSTTRLEEATTEEEIAIYSEDTDEFVLSVKVLEGGRVIPIYD